MGTELDLTGLREKRNRQGTVYYEKGDRIIAKVCTKCGDLKTLTEYALHKGSLGGKKSYCRGCGKESDRKYYESNRGKYRVWGENYRKVNPEKRRDILRKYYESNREKYRLQDLLRRARKVMLPGTLTAKQNADIIEHFNAACALTGEPADNHMDHVIPLATGHGGTTYENMVPLRGDLNLSKNDRNLFDWFADNRDRFGLSQTKFDDLIAYLADINGMTTEEYEAYVRWCHDNPRDLTKLDEEVTEEDAS